MTPVSMNHEAQEYVSTPDSNRATHISSLFFACAMNRADCAEFLIDALDHDEASLYDQDARGDTPLHAAACNGAVDCVLLLLQYGVDPRTTNKKELKAIDLALRNKQTECREILAEYHLHFCTSSAFDSVLFLATLEGHKQVKHSIGEDGYQIIKVSGGEEDDMSAGSGASHPTEAKKTLRSVQRYMPPHTTTHRNQTSRPDLVSPSLIILTHPPLPQHVLAQEEQEPASAAMGQLDCL